MNVSERTAIIGLGSMGLGMARNILSANIALTGYDIVPVARDALAEAGGAAALCAAAAADGADLLILMVVNAKQAQTSLFQDGAAAAMQSGGTVMLCSTVAPSEVRDLEQQITAAGLQLLDAPVSGGKVGADGGTLTIMASGSPESFSRADAVLDAVSKRVLNVGSKPGLGAIYKVVHQLAAGVHLVAAAELMALGARAGCDPQTLFEIVSTSAGQSWMFNDRVPHILEGDYAPRSTLEIFIKDLGLVLQTGKEFKTPLPLSAAAYQMLLAASGMGHGQLDDSAVIKAYEALTGQLVRKP